MSGAASGPTRPWDCALTVAKHGRQHQRVNNQSDSLLNATAGFDFRGPDTRLNADFGHHQPQYRGSAGGTFLSAGLLLPAAPNASNNYYQPWEFIAFNATYGLMRFEHDLRQTSRGFAKVGGSRSNGAFITGFPDDQQHFGHDDRGRRKVSELLREPDGRGRRPGPL